MIVADFVPLVSRTLHIELHHPPHAVESVRFEDSIEVQEYLRRLYHEDHNLENEEDISI